jgi:S-DNA-T family DNA segregation ATPase FtsK/SpoIIIE
MKFVERGGFTDKGMGVDGLALVALGLFTNALAPWMGMSATYGTFAAVGGAGIVILDLFLNHKGKLEKLFINCGLYINTGKEKLIPRVMKVQKHPTKTEYILTLPPGMSLQNFKNCHEAIQQNMRKPVSFDYRNGVIIMTVKEELKKMYPFKLIHYDEPLKVCFGYTSEGPYIFDIEEAVHTLVGGSTGWGKSVFLRVLSVILLNKPVDLYLVDFMRVELGIFKKHPKVKGFCSTAEEFSYLLDDLEDVANKRLKMFEKKNVSGIRSWNKKYTPLNYIVVLIDEFASIASNKQLQDRFNLATAQYRKVGIHFIASTQRCSTDIISGTIKNNMATRICFKVASDTDSGVVIDQPGAEKLKYPGRCLVKTNAMQECQVMYLSEDEALEAVYGE